MSGGSVRPMVPSWWLLAVVVAVAPAARAGNVEFVDCDDSQRSIVTRAVEDARLLSSSGQLYMTGDLNKEHTAYERWFGPYDDMTMAQSGCSDTPAGRRRTKVRDNVRNISLSLAVDDVIVDCSGTIVLVPGEPTTDCREPDNVAFVDRNAVFKTVYLCKPFWDRASSGYNSYAGAIIHEISHFRDVAYTRDIRACDPFGCQQLAAENPDDAIENAYNYQRFFESDPVHNPNGCLVGGGSIGVAPGMLGLFLLPLTLVTLRMGRRRWRSERSRRSAGGCRGAP